MNNEYKKGFLEAIDGVLGIIRNIQKGFEEEKYEEDDSFPYELQKIENAVLSLKISFFEDYLSNKDESEAPCEIVITKKDFLRYAKEQGLTLEEYKEKLKKLINSPDSILYPGLSKDDVEDSEPHMDSENRIYD